MSESPPSRRRWYQFSLSTWLVTVAFIAWLMTDRVLFESFSNPIAKARQKWKRDPFYFHCGYLGPHAAEQIGMDFANMNFGHSRCLTLLVTAKWGGRVHCFHAAIGLDHMIGPMSFLAAFVAWTIGRTIAARRTGQNRPPPRS